ncbi:hypothetical protein [Rhodopseudomonas parapalustris]
MIKHSPKNSKASDDAAEAPFKKLSPSRFMRQLRPEYYSDTEDRVLYVLDAATLDHHLETLTSRNETHEFELFARKLCERAICPNLRAQTGPEGGGDSKADSETFPVADEISRFYMGEPNSGREKWAFAFSAKKTWAQKARNDVKGIVDTGRPYDRIICVTARYAKDKDRARVEAELTKHYGIPVTIHDRSWIKKEVIDNDRKDLAFNYLKVGEEKSDPLQLGPTDYSRARQLDAIERSLTGTDSFNGMERQRVSEALIAAKLSRGLERPRFETEGRFARAIRLANEDGTYRQKLEAQYENIWTAFWWFDDVKLLNDSYSAFEKMALQSDHAANLEFLCNLFQLLVNSVTHRHLTRDAAKLDERAASLRKVLEKVAANKERPNNSLEAETLILIVRQNFVLLDDKRENFSEIWRGYADILDRATGLGEFNAERLVSMIELLGNVSGNDPEYNQLVERVANFVAKRSSEAEGSMVLLKRAQQLDFSNRIDIIRLLGKAAIGLSKKEHTEQLVEALHLLMLAYRAAGLLWAARATCTMAAASIVIEGEEDSTIPMNFVPTMKVWAWIALGLRHVPDFLVAVQTLHGAIAALPLTDESKERVRSDLQELEYAFGSIILNLTDEELAQMTALPDVLEGLELFVARAALLFSLGHSKVLRDDGSAPKEESDEGMARMFDILASQPIAKQTKAPMILNGHGSQSLSAIILGMTVKVTFDGSDLLTVIAEMLLGSIEAFLATVVDQSVMPHTENFRIELQSDTEISAPTIDVNALEMTATVRWPRNLKPTDFGQQAEIRKFLALASGHVLGTTCVFENLEELLERLYGDEAVDSRMAMVAAAVNSYHRVTSRNLTRMSEWQAAVRHEYPIQIRPQITHIELKPPLEEEDTEATNTSTDKPQKMRSHRDFSVRSVIDVHAWDKAGWKGISYFQAGPGNPPGMAFMFENEEAGRKIFERWRQRFGNRDESDDIYISVIRRLIDQPETHYVVLVASRLPDRGESESNETIVMSTRSMTMTPDSSVNLEQFLRMHRAYGMYFILPAIIRNGKPELITELALAKRGLSIKDAASVREHDVEMLALRIRGQPKRAKDDG